MFKKYFQPVLDALNLRGSFDTTPEKLVTDVLETLSGLVQSDRQITENEIGDVLTVMEAEQSQQAKLLKGISIQVAAALAYISDVKTISHVEPDLPRGCRDLLWRAADLAQTQLETTLKEVNPDELTAWLDTRN